ncbi:hypothetical protein [Flavobacterium pectinovorum]|uniref:hypothetical protein n=1 Tax=Flavobacterium pectinovorum TaxID=29533 RepID=UPI001FAC265F|nr:hypothetical protein [Flavobacterium pectinovorum]MCI9844806.1 hypothetical protein [Flavobacterium pectinovorum]
MKVYFENYKTLRSELKWLLYLCFFFIFLIEFILFDIPEIFPKANIIGNIILRLCYSYISALIFYYLVVHFKRQNEKRNYYKVLSKNLNFLLNQGQSLSVTLNKISEKENFDSLILDDLKEVLMKINPNDIFPNQLYIVLGRTNWFKHLFLQSNEAKLEIDLIFKNSALIDAELTSLLNELYKCILFNNISLFSNGNFQNQNLTNFEPIFLDYFQKLDNIQKYKTKEIDKYLN